MGLHIAFIGNGRVGRPTAYTILSEGLASKITVCDTKPGLAKAFAEELRHAAASLDSDVDIGWCEEDGKVEGADIVLVCVGMPRLPGVNISRRDLAAKNGLMIRQVAEQTYPKNPDATYVIITNPADAMATAFAKFSGATHVIGTGTSLETVRFRSKLASVLGVPVSKVKGWVGGEHGEAAVILWSTVTVEGVPVEQYARSKGMAFDKTEIETYMKGITRLIIDNVGGTEYGPAAAFRDVVRAIVRDTKEILPVATPIMIEGVDEPVFVSVPLHLGRHPGPSLFDKLSAQEKAQIAEAAKAVYATFQNAVQAEPAGA